VPKWEPRSKRGQFVGYSPLHASNAGMIRNLNTGYVSPQFHVMHNDFFETMHSDKGSPPSAKVWEQLYTFNCSQVDWDIDPPDLAVEWLSLGERHSCQDQNMNGHIEQMVPLGPPLQREEGQAPATIQPAPATIQPAEAPIEEVVAPGTPQAQLQDPVVPQADVAVLAPSASPTPRRPVRSTRGMAPQRMTYEVKGEPTAYFLAKCFQTMIQGLVTCVN